MAWLNLCSPCLREYISMVTHVGFLMAILTHLLQEWRSPSLKDMSPGEGDGKAKPNSVIKWSISYKAGLFGSVVLLGAHCFTMLYMLLESSATRCVSPVLVFSTESLQVVSWGLICIAVMKVPKKENFKFHWILRAWWLCSFMLSGVYLAFDAHIRISNQDAFGVPDYSDAISFLASFVLLVVSIRGNTGLRFLEYSGDCDPLLDGKNNEEHKKQEKESPYGRATYLQKLTFSWLNPLFSVGFKKPLEQHEIPDIDVNECAEYCSKTFEQDLQRVKERHETTNQSFYKAILLFSWKKAGINALFAVVNAGASYVGPYLINDFVEFLTGKNGRSLLSGYLLAFAFLSAKVVETVAQRQWIFGARQLGLRLRAALTSQIYQKGLLLSSKSRQSHTSGEIMNYMSVDVQRISDFTWYVNTIWMLPIQISSAVFILHTHLGFGAFAALATTLMVMACNIPLTKIQKSYQLNIMNAKDSRMKATSEVLKNMKILKLQAWDNHFLQKIKDLRQKEHYCLRKSLILQATTTFILWGAPALISVVTFGACVLMGIPLTAGGVISALATFQMLQGPVFSLPDLLSVIAQSKVSVDRIASYLQEDEIQQDAIEYTPDHQSHLRVEINNGTFSWDSESRSPTLDGIQLKVKTGMKVAICGSVGSGKSSLISCILGEMHKISGSVRVSGTKAYVPQSPWILSGNIRGNILFGNVYDGDKYERTIKACALRKDFELFSSGDLTEIGERGINMSGGQKQRIQIARAVYQDADIYLLDDPFSALDAHTGRQLFEECLLGLLKHKTVLYVTHQVEFFSAADLILVMQDGRIAQAGRFEELLQQNIGFGAMVGAHSEALGSIFSVKESSRAFQDPLPEDRSNTTDMPQRIKSLQAQQNSDQNISLETKQKETKLVQDEEREKGGIGRQVYWAYLTMVKGGCLIPIILLFQSCFQVLQISSNYWMAWASPPTADVEPKFGMNIVLFVYTALAIASSLCVLGRAMLVAVAGLWTAENLFSKMLDSVFRAPMRFFDSTPTGRILNRVSTDQSVVDLEIAVVLGWCAFSIIQIMGTIAVMSQVAWQVFVLCIPVAAVCIWYQKYYTPTARELARLAGIQRAPILHHFAESLAGSTTIRAFDQQGRFISSNLDLIDNHNRPWFHNVSAIEWLSFRINLLSHFVFAFTLVLLVSIPEGTINPSIAGLGVTYGLNLNVLQATIIWNICNAENKMISVERILQYSNLKSEAPTVVESQRPPDNWPDVGTIIFSNLQVRYAEHFPPVLKNISCTFPGGKKVGVVGRTGSGKSTLTQAIFRIVEPNLGSIVIDGLDICSIGLLDLRSRLSIIPQDPVLFDGTVRGNIDPLSQYTEPEVWQALEKCQLGELVRGKEEKLDAIVVENGENWSVGQRQLFCLGRVLLKKSNILILDEATASVDSATDGVIQRVISREFADRTVITIAHRIHTVMDSDLVLVLSDGTIAEFDTPTRLLQRDDSFFSKLIKEYSCRTKKSFSGFDNLHQSDNKGISHNFM